MYHRYLKVDNWGQDIKCEGEIISFYKIPASPLLLSKPAIRSSEMESATFVGQYWQLVDQVNIEPSGDKNEKGEPIEGAYKLDDSIIANAFPLQAVCPSPDKFTKEGTDPYGVDQTPKYNKQACVESLRLLQKICTYDLDCNQYEKEKIVNEAAQENEKQNEEIQKLEDAYKLAKAQAEKKSQDDIVAEVKSIETITIDINWSVVVSNPPELVDWFTSGKPLASEFMESGKTTLSSFVASKADKDGSVMSALASLNAARKAAGEASTKTSDENKATLEDKAKKAQELRERINFLDNRISELDMSILVDDSSGFNVTKVLQMREDSKEGQLKIIGGDSKRNIFDKIIRLVAQTIGTFGVLLLIVAAFYMITSQGDENQLQKGKQIFIYTALGLLVAFLSYTIVQLVLDLLLW